MSPPLVDEFYIQPLLYQIRAQLKILIWTRVIYYPYDRRSGVAQEIPVSFDSERVPAGSPSAPARENTVTFSNGEVVIPPLFGI